ELFVPAPVDDTDRREIAMLARAISMRLEPINEPGAALDASPPPPPTPPPPPAPPPPAITQVERPSPPRPDVLVEPPAPPPVDVQVLEPVPEPPAEDPVADDASDDGTGYDSTIVVSDVGRSRHSDALVAIRELRRARRAERRALLAAPPISLLFGTSARREAQMAGVVGIDVAAITTGPVVVGTEFAVQGARSIGLLDDALDDGDDLWRQFIDVRGLASVGLQVHPMLRVGVVGGATYRTFRQQFVPVQTSILPVVGVQGEAVVGRIVRSGVRFQVLRDLVATELVDSTGVSRTLVPLDVTTSFVFRIQPRQRPRPGTEELERPAPRTMDIIDLEEMPES
ncbi:MAG: hypothetical protein AAF211_20720, partial [Myxococcota bacterium]